MIMENDNLEKCSRRDCEILFASNAPFFHIYTTPPEKELLFINKDDYKEATNMLAIASTESKVKMLSYAIMSNHLHNVVSASRDKCDEYAENLRKRLSMFTKVSGRNVPDLEFNVVQIETLRQLRDEIAYVIRNPYVARTDVNPFSYPWCTGFLYYNHRLLSLLQGVPVSDLSINMRRALKHSRNPGLCPSLKVLDGLILPSSFVDYQLVMSLFENARQFVWWSTRNVEAGIVTAARLGEKGILTDEEAYAIALKLSKQECGQDNPRLLSQQHKKQLLLSLKYDYGASNKQLSRCTGISLQYINEMFPLGTRS